MTEKHSGDSALRAFILFLLGALCSPVFAQEAPVTPGQVLQPFRTPPELPKGKLPPEEIPSAPPGAKIPPGGPAIQVNKFTFSGNTVFTAAQLRAKVASYEGKKLTVAEIHAAADALSQYYRDHGYMLATVAVPPQKVIGGVVRLEVIEGRVDHLKFEGNKDYSTDFLAAFMRGMSSGEVVRRDILERDLLLLNDLPGLQTTTVVSPGSKYGTSDLLFRSHERFMEAQVSADNYGRRSIGRYRLTGNLDIYNPLGIGDHFDASLSWAQAGLLKRYAVGYDVGVNHLGTRLQVNYSRDLYRVDTNLLGPAFAGLSLGGTGEDVSVRLTHPLLRSRLNNLLVSLGYDHSRTTQSGYLATKGPAVLDLMNLYVLYSHVHADQAVTSLSFNFASNFRSNPDGTRQNAQMARFELDAQHLRNLFWGWQLFGSAMLVYSVDPLLDASQPRLGGPGSVRGYQSAEISGDDAVELTLELRHHLNWLKYVPATFSVFCDGGVVHRKPQRRALAPQAAMESIASAGIGLDFQVFGNVTVSLQAVKPVTSHKAGDGRNERFWLYISTHFDGGLS